MPTRKHPIETQTEEETDDAAEQPDEALPFPIVGIGASAGGIEAFKEMLAGLPADTGMAFVLVQHLAPGHTSLLAEILSRATKMRVTQVEDETVVEPNHVYVIPPGRTMLFSKGRLQLHERTDGTQHRPIDAFLRSLACERRYRAVGVILSGTATDGTLGLEEIKAEGGITIAQNDSAGYTSMPRSAVATGCVDFVLPPAGIAEELTRISRHPYVLPPSVQIDEPSVQEHVRGILQTLHDATGVDFTHYKMNTLMRRITRRMLLHKLASLADYRVLLGATPSEVDALYQDILISVTSFFRNAEVFDALKSKVFPALVKNRSRHEPIRVWTLGCSTGEETYSIAMAYTEFCEESGSHIPMQLFATDLNGYGVERARAGVYAREIAQDVSVERLRRFFVRMDGSYRIAKPVRDMCVFARHNLLVDPPFSRIDLVSCRNLLIYLESPNQQKAMAIFHYALRPNGFLLLGSSETIGGYRSLFDPVDVKHKIYAKKPGPARVSVAFGKHPVHRGTMEDGSSPLHVPASRTLGLTDAQKEADRMVLTRFAPPSVLVGPDLEIVTIRGDTSPYLSPAPGKASLNVLKMAREGLLVGLRAAIHKARKEETAVREPELRVRAPDGYRTVDLEVMPVRGRTPRESSFLILFEEAGSRPARPEPVAPTLPAESGEREVHRLTQELAATREYLQSVIEQQEAVNEELQSANEEVQSANEELQSINEELETSKEEIQSSNEELATVNDELQNRNLELAQTNNDLTNLISSVQMPIIMLGPDLRIRRYTPAAEKALNLIPTDVGRPLTDLKLPVDVSDLDAVLADVIESVRVRELDVRDKNGRRYSLQVRPYRTLENKIDGAVLALIEWRAPAV